MNQILEFVRKIFLKGFQIYQNYLCALMMLLKCKFFRGFIFFSLAKTLLACRAMQLRFFKWKHCKTMLLMHAQPCIKGTIFHSKPCTIREMYVSFHYTEDWSSNLAGRKICGNKVSFFKQPPQSQRQDIVLCFPWG